MGSADTSQGLVRRLDPASLTLLVEERKGELYHLPPELADLASLHALWGYLGGYASYVGMRFAGGLRRGLKLPSADEAGEAVGNAISAKVAGLRGSLAERRVLSEEELAQEAGELEGVLSAIRADPIDEAARRRSREALRDALKEKGATRRQATEIADEVDRTVFGDSLS